MRLRAAHARRLRRMGGVQRRRRPHVGHGAPGAALPPLERRPGIPRQRGDARRHDPHRVLPGRQAGAEGRGLAHIHHHLPDGHLVASAPQARRARRPRAVREPLHRLLVQRTLLRGGGVSLRPRAGGARHRQHLVELLQRLPLRRRPHSRLLPDPPLRLRLRRPGRPARDAIHGRLRPRPHQLHERLPQGDAERAAGLLRRDAGRQQREGGDHRLAPRRHLPHQVHGRQDSPPLRRPPVRHPQLGPQGRRKARARMRGGAGRASLVLGPPAHLHLGGARGLLRRRVRP